MRGVQRGNVSIQIGSDMLPLSYKGNLPKLMRANQLVSVIGWRKADDEALSRVHRIVCKLNARNACVVTGMAPGVDTRAFYAATQCIGVLVEGIDIKYVNSTLRERLENESLALVSQFHCNATWKAPNAMLRNKTIALWSKIVIVGALPESKEHSGTWNMVDFCLSQPDVKLFCVNPDQLSTNNPSRNGLRKLVSDYNVPIINA